MKLNKKIVAGLATAALFAPLALNNVQVNANVENGGTSAVNINNNQHITKQQVIDALKQADVGADEGKLNDNIPSTIQSDNIKNIADFTDGLSNNKNGLLSDFLHDHNNNDFINSTSSSDVSSVITAIDNVKNNSNNIKNNLDQYKKDELIKVINQYKTNDPKFDFNTDNKNFSQLYSGINHINEKKDASNNSEKFNQLKDNTNNDNLINGDGTTNDYSDTYDDAIGKIYGRIGTIKSDADTINSLNQQTALERTFDKNGNGKLKDNNLPASISDIVNNINDISDFNNRLNNLYDDNKNALLNEVLKNNNITEEKTGINIDEGNKATTVANKLTELYNESNKSPSSAPTYQAPVVITNDNNSNSNNTNQSSKPTETNNSHEVQFPSAPKSDNVVKDSHATKVNNAKADVKKAEKQLSNAKSNKAKNNAVKSINKAKANLAKLNSDQKSTLKDAKKSVKKAEKQVKKAKTSDAQKSANASLKAAQTNYTQLNKYIK